MRIEAVNYTVHLKHFVNDVVPFESILDPVSLPNLLKPLIF
jgi:hypothetical protein